MSAKEELQHAYELLRREYREASQESYKRELTARMEVYGHAIQIVDADTELAEHTANLEREREELKREIERYEAGLKEAQRARQEAEARYERVREKNREWEYDWAPTMEIALDRERQAREQAEADAAAKSKRITEARSYLVRIGARHSDEISLRLALEALEKDDQPEPDTAEERAVEAEKQLEDANWRARFWENQHYRQDKEHQGTRKLLEAAKSSAKRERQRADQAEADAKKACRILMWGDESMENKIRRAIDVLEQHYQPELQGENGDALSETLAKMPQHPQRQDSLYEQLQHMRVMANRLGLYDAADWVTSMSGKTYSEPDTAEGRGELDDALWAAVLDWHDEEGSDLSSAPLARLIERIRNELGLRKLLKEAQPAEQGAGETSKTLEAALSWRNDDPRKHGSNRRKILAVFGEDQIPRFCFAGAAGNFDWWNCQKWRELVEGVDY